MACENCFNGCADITSDKCVKYTGVNIPGLGINTGDSLFLVEQKITDKILTLMDGSGIKPIIDPNDICTLVSDFFPSCPECPPLSLNAILTAYVKAICALDTRLTEAEADIIAINLVLDALNADYTIGCLEGVTAESDTHDIVQAIITKLCIVEDSLTLYVHKDILCELVTECIAANAPTDLMSNKMVPWVAVPFFDPNALSYFSASGSGLPNTPWENIYLCNGQNLTPDLRGRVVVGVTSMPDTVGAPLTPGVNGNPTYELSGANSTAGVNAVGLTIANMPPHQHPSSTVQIIDPGHTHGFGADVAIRGGSGPAAYSNSANTPTHDISATTSSITGITATPIIASEGGGVAHANIQPVRAAYWIIYIPA